MIRNYLKIALRNLKRDKLYSFINIAGLAIGLACCLLILLFLKNEWTFDEFHTKADRISRVSVLEKIESGEEFFNTVTSYVIAPSLKANLPEIEQVATFFVSSFLIRNDSHPDAVNESVHLVSPEFLQMFDFPAVHGNSAKLLTGISDVVLTEKTAQKYFGTQNPVGKVLQIKIQDDFVNFVVKGILQNPPTNASHQFGMLIHAEYIKKLFSERALNSWTNVYLETYVLFKAGTNTAALKPKLTAMLRTAFGNEYREGGYNIGFQPLTDIHLNRDFPAGIVRISDKKYSYILGGVALLIILIACINFMTLSIGQSVSRAKEIGIRKVSGALRPQLMGQFLSETLVLTLVSVVLGIALAWLALPLFNQMANQQLIFDWSVFNLLIVLLLVLVVALVAGSYPAIILSGLQPVSVLKGSLSLKSDGRAVRTSMVVVQLVFSVFLIACALIMQNQLSYLQDKNLGFDKEKLVVIPFQSPTAQRFSETIQNGFKRGELLKNEISKIADVKQVSIVTQQFENGWARLGYEHPIDGKMRFFSHNIVDANYIRTAGMQIVAGRDFIKDNGSDARQSIIVNEALVREYGWKQPIGQKIPGKNFETHEVIGVVKDFNYASLHTKIEPLVLCINPLLMLRGASDISINSDASPKLLVRIGSAQAIDQIRKTWQQIAPQEPFDFRFVDDKLNAQYKNEQNLGEISTTSSLLAIAIAMFGLFGLASFSITKRTKEIGIRKVLGASAISITALLSKDFLKLVLVAIVIASPIAWWVMTQWLQDFAYRTEINWWVFLLAGLLVLVITLLTVSYRSIKAALMNPVKSLKTE